MHTAVRTGSWWSDIEGKWNGNRLITTSALSFLNLKSLLRWMSGLNVSRACDSENLASVTNNWMKWCWWVLHLSAIFVFYRTSFKRFMGISIPIFHYLGCLGVNLYLFFVLFKSVFCLKIHQIYIIYFSIFWWFWCPNIKKI